MNWILGLFFIIIIAFLATNYSRKKKTASLKKWLFEHWGKSKKEDYFNFYVIGKYFENNEHKNSAFHIISEKCKSDLDLDEIFKFIDRTTSKIGQQYLYFKLRTIGNIEHLLKFNTLTSLFEHNKTLSIHCQLLLSKLSSNDSYYLEELINGKQIEKPKILWLVKLLSITALVSVFLVFFYPIFALLIVAILIVNLFFHYRNKSNINYYLNGVRQLSKSLRVGKKLSESSEIKLLYKNFSFIKKVEKIQLKTEFIAFEKNIDNEFVFLIWFVVEFFKILFNIEYIVFFSFIDAISKEKESIEKLFLFIGEIDAAISTASLKAGNKKLCTPTFTKEKQLISKEIYHPLIKNCIANNVNLINNSMLLTGSNMSGKTTFIRTMAINSILAQSLNICFAETYTAPYLKIYSSIRITDDLLEDTSYYLEEVLSIKKLLEASKSNDPCLFVLDEIFKGTNTIERISGGKAILSFLNKKNHTVLVSTHDIELTSLLEVENYELYHFSEQIEGDALIFDHKLKNGKLKTRNAIKILELFNYPDEIITDARQTESDGFN
ncbi:MAG: DNA mismatch repair protein MutS [Bacteroidetes bacterium]|nr:DNA mismatch repair protein MutS [Bacteroidota bacterium]